MESITIVAPIKEFNADTGNYGLIITDALGVEHYFDYDGTYDGWSKDCNPDGSCGLPLNPPQN